MKIRKRGRPPKIDPAAKKISIDQAVELVRQYWAQYDMPGYSKGYIYNLISSGQLSRLGNKNRALLLEDEVKEKLCG